MLHVASTVIHLRKNEEVAKYSGRINGKVVTRCPVTQLMPSDPYSVLGILPSAEKSEVKKAFREKALATHPDL
jgi:DnaJ-class molecular chaperone